MNIPINTDLQEISFNGQDVEELVYNGVTVWTKTQPDYEHTRCTFEILTSGTITFTSSASNWQTIKYNYYNEKTGQALGEITCTSAGNSINVNAGDKISFKLYNNELNFNPQKYYSIRISTTCEFNLSGNMCTLATNSTNIGMNLNNQEYALSYFFYGCTGLKSAKNLYIPIITKSGNDVFLPDNYLKYTFYGCTNLEYPPVFYNKNLTYTSMGNSSFFGMFQNCSKLKYTPILRCTGLYGNNTTQYQAYAYMFSGCSSLTDSYITFTGTKAANSEFKAMFRGCSNLVNLNITSLPYTTIYSNGMYEMFRGCSKITTAPTLSGTTLNESCYQGMFYDCTNLETAPELLATTLTTNCYKQMFFNCSKINYIKCLANSSSSNYSSQWLYNVSPTGTFVKKRNISWSTGASGIPSGWTIEQLT